MNTHPSHSMDLGRPETVLPLHREPVEASKPATRTSHAARAESMQKSGKRMILAGFVITIVGVVLYCVTCFAGSASADLGDILLKNAVPFARGTLALLGFGTLVWLVGSLTYLRGAMDADDETRRDGPRDAA